MVRAWKFSRKSRDWSAIGKFKITRDPMPDVVKTGTLKGEGPASWRVEFDDEDGLFFVSKNHAQLERRDRTDSTVEVTMPAWLWEKMAEEGGR